MKPPEWHQRALIVTNDPEIQATVSSAFGAETELSVAADSPSAVKKLEEGPLHVLILDTATTDPKLLYFEEQEKVSFQELVQYATQLNQGLTVVILANKMLIRDGSFSRKSGASLIMDRKSISVNRMLYVIRVLRKRTFRTILARDLRDGTELPAALFHFLPANNRFSAFLPKGTAVTPAKLEKLRASLTKHLYSKENDFPKVAAAIRSSSGLSLSEELAHARAQYAALLRALFDISTDGNFSLGKKLLADGFEIVQSLDKMIASYPDPLSCLAELPFPRWSAIAHGINSAIFSLIFARQCELLEPAEIAWAGLMHNIGLAEVNQKLLLRSELALDAEERSAYHLHVENTLDILKTKQIPVSQQIEDAIRFHHENFDGSGYPEGRAGTLIPLEAALLAIVGAFDHLFALQPGSKALTPAEAWGELLKLQGSTTLGKKFHPGLLEKISPLFG